MNDQSDPFGLGPEKQVPLALLALLYVFVASAGVVGVWCGIAWRIFVQVSGVSL